MEECYTLPQTLLQGRGEEASMAKDKEKVKGESQINILNNSLGIVRLCKLGKFLPVPFLYKYHSTPPFTSTSTLS